MREVHHVRLPLSPPGDGGARRGPDQVKREGWQLQGITRLPPWKFPARAEAASGSTLMSRPASENLARSCIWVAWAQQHGGDSDQTSGVSPRQVVVNLQPPS